MAKKSPVQQADERLAVEQFPHLNELYYGSKPHDMLMQSLMVLALVASRDDEVTRLFCKGIELGKFTWGPTEVDEESLASQESKDGVRDWVTAEAEVLLHRAAETVLRMYLAHRNWNPCPWLEIARLRTPGEFKRQVKAIIETPPSTDELAAVFHGKRPERPLPNGVDEEAFAKAHRNIGAFLRQFADIHLDRAGSYNAIKHGNAVLAGKPGFSIEGAAGMAPLTTEGTGLTFIDLKRNGEGEIKWHMSTRWLDTPHAISLIRMAIYMVEQMWGVGRARLTSSEPEKLTLEVVPFALSAVDELRPEGMSSLDMSLTYYVAQPEEQVPVAE